MKATFTRKSDGTCDIKFAGLTQGKALALAHALEARAVAGSAVTEDLMIAFRNAVMFEKRRILLDSDQQLFEALQPSDKIGDEE